MMRNKSIKFIFVFFVLPILFGFRPASLDDSYKKYEPLIDQIREMNLKSGMAIQFRLDDLSNFKSLREIKKNEKFMRGKRAGLVWVEIDKNNKLKVTIETNDNGHAGERGFAYSDEPFITEPFGNGWLRMNVAGGYLFLATDKMKINDHWWEVVYNLD